TPESAMTGPIGPHRRWTHRSVGLDAVKSVGHTLGGTVNDVVLTAITMGYRDLVTKSGGDPTEAVITSLVPVSVRGSDGDGVLDNRVSALLLNLPVDYEEPLECFEEVRARMAELKGSHMAEAGSVVTDLSDLAPPVMVESLTKVGLLAQHRSAQRSVTTITTNVPGPQFPLYCLGCEMLAYLPYVPISYGTRIATAILSYNGSVAFGLTADYDADLDVESLGDGIIAGMDRLVALT
ncbi:MAG: WS/DGAT domain-containing protein, partial [Microthrixaceae bacterium]